MALFVISLVALLGICALVVDVGAWYLEKRRDQSAADAGALAGAARIQAGAVSVTGLSGLTASNLPQGAISYSVTTSIGAGGADTVTARATSRPAGVFSEVLGLNAIDTSATATAQLQTYTELGGNVAPWTIDAAHLTFSAPATLKVDAGDSVSPGNFGGLSLPNVPSCGTGGASVYRGMIARTDHACGLHVGDQVEAKPGNMAGPTSQGLDDRGVINGFDPAAVYQADDQGRMTITNYDHPNVVLVPIVQSFHNGSSTPLTIVSFQFFIITSYTSNTITGEFVKDYGVGPNDLRCPTADDDTATCATGPYQPGTATSVVRLTG